MLCFFMAVCVWFCLLNNSWIVNMKKILYIFFVLAALCGFVTGCGNYDDDIDRLNGAASDITPSINALESTDKNLRGLISALDAKAADLQSSIDDIEKRLAESGDSGLQAKLESLRSETQSQLDDVKASIDALEKKDDELRSKINSLKEELRQELSPAYAQTIKKAVEDYDASVKEYVSGVLAGYYTEKEITELLDGYYSKTEIEKYLDEFYYTKDAVDAGQISFVFVPEYSGGLVRVPFRIKDGKYCPEDVRMTFMTSYSGDLDGVLKVEEAKVVYTDAEPGQSSGQLSVSESVTVKKTEFDGSGFTVVLSGENLHSGFFVGRENAAIALKLSVNGRKVLPDHCAMTPMSLDPDVRTFWLGDASFRMIKVESGAFYMGSWGDDAAVRHQVTLTRDYWIAETELTMKVYRSVMGDDDNVRSWQAGGSYWFYGDNCPAVNLSWEDTQAFIEKLNGMTGESFRLPTEAEWEFAVDGGNKSESFAFPGSNFWNDVAWSWKNTRKFHSVGMKRPNELGIYDMAGNAPEWCSDWYAPYSEDDQIDPTGPETGSEKVYRGGDFKDESVSNLYPATRFHTVISGGTLPLGITARLALTDKQK